MTTTTQEHVRNYPQMAAETDRIEPSPRRVRQSICPMTTAFRTSLRLREAR